MNRSLYSSTIQTFLTTDTETIIGKLSIQNEFSLVQEQRDS
jgi:hypothetical protein